MIEADWATQKHVSTSSPTMTLGDMLEQQCIAVINNGLPAKATSTDQASGLSGPVFGGRLDVGLRGRVICHAATRTRCSLIGLGIPLAFPRPKSSRST